MFNYGLKQSKTTPAPQILITAYAPTDSTLKSDVEAILDSGAVMTCLPKKVIAELGAENLDFSLRRVKGAMDFGVEQITYFVNIKFSNKEYKDVEVIALERDYALIGRDIMNKHNVNMNGPKKKWRIIK